MMQQNNLNLYSTDWAPLTTAAATTPAEELPYSMAVASVQFSGTFGGGTAPLEISNDGTSWFTARDRNNDAISTTGATLVDLSSGATRVRAKIAGGNGSTAVTVELAVWIA